MKNNEKQKRYAVGYYNHEERVDNSSNWNKYAENRLVNHIYDNKSEFNMRYKSFDKDKMWFMISPEELNIAKEYFTNDKDVLELIDLCNDYDKWKTSCECCDSISINTLPYTYREYGGFVGRAYNCVFCCGLKNRIAYEVTKEYQNNGVEGSINLLVNILNGNYVDKDEVYYCSSCDYDLRILGFVHNGKYIINNNEKGEWSKISVDNYNKLEEEKEKEIDGYWPRLYNKEIILQEEWMNGYRCFNCNTKIEEDVVDKIVDLAVL